MNIKNRKSGFTLVEIMIVVVIIGLLAAMAIPAFQKVRMDSRSSALVNDARQLGAAAQQYFLQESATTVTINYTPSTGEIGGELTPWVKVVGKGYTAPSAIELDTTFTMSHPQVLDSAGNAVVFEFNSEGQQAP